MATNTLSNGIKQQDTRATSDGPAQRIYDNDTLVNTMKGVTDAVTTAPTTVDDATERKAISGGVVGVTRVIQTNLPGILWNLVAADVSLDASWIGLPYTVDPDGDVVVSMELANVTGIVPDANVLGVSGGVPSIGDGGTTSGRKVIMNTKPAGMAYMVSTADSGQSVAIYVKTTTGNAAVRWWDGTVEEGGTGSVPDTVIFTKAIPANGNAWSGPSPKEVYVWSCTAAASPTDPTQVGDITYLNCPNSNLTTLDASGLTELTLLRCPNNNLTALDVSGLTALVSLSCYSNNLTTLDVSGFTALTELDCYANNLTALDASGLTALVSLNCQSNDLTTLDVSGCTALTELDCYANNLTALDASGLTALSILDCNNNNLTFLDVTGTSSYEASTYSTIDLSNNAMTESSLNAFFLTLPVITSGVGVEFDNNPGTGTANTGLIPSNWTF